MLDRLSAGDPCVGQLIDLLRAMLCGVRRLLLVPAFALFYWFAARFGGKSKERKHERGAMLVTLPNWSMK
jgi:hypothetical protein